MGHIVKVLYGAVALPIVRYGSTLWFEGTKNIMVRRSLMALQRGLLLLTTRACRTTSTIAMQVIARAKPMDLEVVEDALVKRVRRNLSTVWDTYSFREREMERFDDIVHLEIKFEIDIRPSRKTGGRRDAKPPLVHRLVCGLDLDASRKTGGGRRDAGPPLVSRLVCGFVRNASRKSGGGRRDAEPPLVHRLVCGLIRDASGKTGGRRD